MVPICFRVSLHRIGTDCSLNKVSYRAPKQAVWADGNATPELIRGP